jgi:hypothetical protein
MIYQANGALTQVGIAIFIYKADIKPKLARRAKKLFAP